MLTWKDNNGNVAIAVIDRFPSRYIASHAQRKQNIWLNLKASKSHSTAPNSLLTIVCWTKAKGTVILGVKTKLKYSLSKFDG